MTRLPSHFLDTLCSQYAALLTPTPRLFEQTREKVYLLLSSVRRCENVVLNESKYGDEVKEILKIEGTILLMLEWIDDILLAISWTLTSTWKGSDGVASLHIRVSIMSSVILSPVYDAPSKYNRLLQIWKAVKTLKQIVTNCRYVCLFDMTGMITSQH